MSTLSIRALWIIDSSTWKLIASRRYPTVERRAKKLYHDQYNPLPTVHINETLLSSFKNQSLIQNNFYQHKNPNNIPLINSISCRGKKIAPLISVVYTDLKVVIAALPLMPSASAAQEALKAQNTKNNSISVFPFHRLPVITAAMSIMDDISKYMRMQSSKDLPIQAARIHAYLTQCLPFGTPTDTHPHNVRLLLTRPFAPSSSSSSSSLSSSSSSSIASKRPVWRIQEATRGRPRVAFYVSEQISTAQFDSNDDHHHHNNVDHNNEGRRRRIPVRDEWRISGAVHCNTELDGIYDITVAINNTGAVSDIRTHPCVQSSSTIASHNNSRNNSSSSSSSSHVKIAFTPPSGPFTLASYRVQHPVRKFPIRGFYQMKEINEYQVKILVQLKLDSQMKNEFKHLVVRIPFPNRPPIRHYSLSKTAGALGVSPDGHDLLWDLGKKITSRNLEVAMPGKVYFEKDTVNNHQKKRRKKMMDSNVNYEEENDEEEEEEENDNNDEFYTHDNNNNNDNDNEDDDDDEEHNNNNNYNNNNNNNNNSEDIYHHHHYYSTQQQQSKQQQHSNHPCPIDDDLLKDIEESKREWEEEGDAFFGQGENAYVAVHMHMTNTTLSGVGVDAQSLTVYPTPPTRIQSVANIRQVITGKYIIWNSLGDSKHS